MVCNSTTAIRIEVVESLFTSAFLNCLQRFLCLTARRTQHIRIDCSTAFVGANNVLQKEFPELFKKFSTPASSHHQGTVERQIRTFMEVCDGILGADNQKRLPTDFELITIFREAEYTINTRPLGKFIGGPKQPQITTTYRFIVRLLQPIR